MLNHRIRSICYPPPPPPPPPLYGGYILVRSEWTRCRNLHQFRRKRGVGIRKHFCNRNKAIGIGKMRELLLSESAFPIEQWLWYVWQIIGPRIKEITPIGIIKIDLSKSDGNLPSIPRCGKNFARPNTSSGFRQLSPNVIVSHGMAGGSICNEQIGARSKTLQLVVSAPDLSAQTTCLQVLYE